MMVLVTIIAETGIFDWLAVYAYKVKGNRAVRNCAERSRVHCAFIFR